MVHVLTFACVALRGQIAEVRGRYIQPGSVAWPSSAAVKLNGGDGVKGLRIHLAVVRETEVLDLLQQRARSTREGHVLVDDPASADLILLLGNYAERPRLLLDHPVYREYSGKCAVYNDDDIYIPLLPGVYASAVRGFSSAVGRVFSYAHVSRNGRYTNPYVQGGAKTSKDIFFSFVGGSTSLVRKRLFNLGFERKDILIRNTSTYYHWDDTQADRSLRQREYADVLLRSHFVLCPRGAGSSSIRLFESMLAGSAPVLIADDYLLPPNVDWDSFLLKIPESRINRIEEFLEPHLASAELLGKRAQEAYLGEYGPDVEFDRIVDLCHRARRHKGIPETMFRMLRPWMIARSRLGRGMRRWARDFVIWCMRRLKIRNPYQMNER